jgi:hypothetical protein
MKPGSLIIFNFKKGGIFSSGQRLFTHYWLPGNSPKKYAKSYATHVALVSHDIEGVPSYFGSELSTCHIPLDEFAKNPDVDYIVFEPTKLFTEKNISDVLTRIYKEYAGRTYGFSQIPWFIYRGLVENLTSIDMRKARNPFPKNSICSEVGYRALSYYSETFNISEIPALLNQYRMDSFHAGDMLTTLLQLSRFFTVSEMRWTTPLPEELPLVLSANTITKQKP